MKQTGVRKTMALKTNWPRTSVLHFGSDDKFDSFIHFSLVISRFFSDDLL